MSNDNGQQENNNRIVPLQTISNIYFADLSTKNTLELLKQMKDGFVIKEKQIQVKVKPFSKKIMSDIFTISQQIDQKNLKISGYIMKIKMYESFINDLGSVQKTLTLEEMDKTSKQIEGFQEQRELLFEKKNESEKEMIELWTKHKEIIAYEILGLTKDEYENNVSLYKDIIETVIFAYENRLLNIEITDDMIKELYEKHRKANKIFFDENKPKEKES